MALEIFGLLDADGCNNGGGYIFCGAPKDLMKLAKPLQEFYTANRRKKKVAALAEKIALGAKLAVPMVRMDRAEAVVFMDVVAELAEGKPPSNAYAKLYERVMVSLCVYGH
jgi:hypothetical protein